MQLKFLGVAVYMNGQNYYIPSLSTRDYKRFEPVLTEPIDREKPLDTFEKYLPIIGAAMRRNYPDVTDDMLGEWLDLRTFNLAMQAVHAASGMTAVSSGE